MNHVTAHPSLRLPMLLTFAREFQKKIFGGVDLLSVNKSKGYFDPRIVLDNVFYSVAIFVPYDNHSP
jgi:hypothetical protein